MKTDLEDPFEIVTRALDCIHRDQDNPSWSPCNFPHQWFVVWAVVHSFGIIGNGGLRFFFENDWPKGVTYAKFIEAYNTIGAIESAQCLSEVVSLLFGDKHDIGIEERRTILDKWDNVTPSLLANFSRIFLIPNNQMDRLLSTYISKNESYFGPQNKR
jgi:hypothetical protein